MERQRLAVLFFCLLFVLGMVTSERSWAQGTEKSTPTKGEDGWRFLIAPYVWVTAVQGSAEGKRGNKVNTNVTVGDALNLIDEIEFIGGPD